MIENIHSHEGEDEKTKRSSMSFRPPKNIKQIGESTSQKKIYVEDYVFTYIKELVKKEYSNCKIAVLLGQYIKTNDERIIMIHGAVEAIGIHFDSEKVFNNDTWTDVYDNIKKYFTDVEVVGWCIGGPGFILENEDKLKKIHLDNFAGVDKAFMKYDSIEGEESFYIYEHGGLNQQTGYYIYYEKNDEMQNYMIESKKEVVMTEKEKEEKVVREYKAEVKEQRIEENNKNIIHLMYAAGSLMVVLVIVVFTTLINNNHKISNLEQSIGELNNILFAGNGDSEKKDPGVDVVAKGDQTNGKDTMDVETISGNLNSIKGEEVVGDKAAKANESDSMEEKKGEKTEGETGKEAVSSNESSDTQDVEGKQNDEAKEEMPKDSATDTQSKGSTEEEPTSPTSKPETEAKDTDSLPASSDSANIKYYEVKEGDTLVGISFKLYNSGDYVMKIMELNNIENMDMIYYGQKLIVP